MEKLCPISVLGPTPRNHACIRDKCAWFRARTQGKGEGKEDGDCAILVLAEIAVMQRIKP